MIIQKKVSNHLYVNVWQQNKKQSIFLIDPKFQATYGLTSDINNIFIVLD